MFTKLSLFLMIFLLASCGGRNASTTLKVSSGFALSNNTYPGGLVLLGKDTNGHNFSIPMDYNSSSGTSQVSLDLPYGNWTFYGIGWTTASFTGPKCDSKTLTLNEHEQTVDLILDTNKCSDSIFSSPSFVAAAPNVDTLAFYTCGTLFSDDALTTAVTAGTISSYCTGLTKPELKRTAGSIRIEIPELHDGSRTGKALSSCVPTVTGNASTSFKIPSRLPLTIALYDDPSCTPASIITQYELDKGFGGNYPDQDFAVFNDGTSANKIALLANRMKKGYAPLISLSPAIDCSGARCATLLGITSPPASRLIRPGKEFVFDPNSTDCPTALSMTPTSITSYTAATDCRVVDNMVLVKLDFAAGGCSSACTLSESAPQSRSFTVKGEPVHIRSLDMFEEVFSVLGRDSTSPNMATLNSLPRFLRHAKSYDGLNFGLIGLPKFNFTPAGLMSIFGTALTTATCATFTDSQSVSVWEDGQQVSYQIHLTNDGVAVIPPYIENNGTADPATSLNLKFDKRLHVKRVNGPTLTSVLDMHFLCARPIGMIEETKDLPSGTGFRKQLAYWNTYGTSIRRAEFYTYHKETDPADGSIVNVETSFHRVENAVISSAIIVQSSRFESRKDSSGNYNERAVKSHTSLESPHSSAVYQDTVLEHSGSTPYGLFNDNYLAKSRADRNPARSGTSAEAYTSTGTFLKAHQIWNSTNSRFDLQVLYKIPGANTVYKTPIDTSDANQSRIKIVTNSNGRALIMWANSTGAYAIEYSGSAFYDIAGGVFTFSSQSAALLESGSSNFVTAIYDPDTVTHPNDFIITYLGTSSSLRYKTKVAGTNYGPTAFSSVSGTLLDLQMSYDSGGAIYVGWAKDASGVLSFNAIQATGGLAAIAFAGVYQIGSSVTPYDSFDFHFGGIEPSTAKIFTQSHAAGSPTQVNAFSFDGSSAPTGSTISGSSIATEEPMSCISLSSSLGMSASCYPQNGTFAPPVQNLFDGTLDSLHPSTFKNIFSL